MSSARGLQAGQYYDTYWTDVGGAFASLQIGGGWAAPRGYANKARLRWTVKVLRIKGNVRGGWRGSVQATCCGWLALQPVLGWEVALLSQCVCPLRHTGADSRLRKCAALKAWRVWEGED